MEYCESDLEHVIRDRSRLLSAGDIKAYMQAGVQTGDAYRGSACQGLSGWLQGWSRWD